MKRFLLLNKDIVILEFSAVEKNCRIEYDVCSIERKDLIPKDLRCIGIWINSRYVLLERRSLGRIMKFARVNSFIDFLEITNGVSLKDTYWVKEVNSEKNWSMVPPYSNSLNRLMSDYAFNRGLTGKTVYGSPEFATDGSFEKCWRKHNGGIYLYKRGSSCGCNAGNEPYSEVYAYKIATAMGIDCCEYKLGIYKGVMKCINDYVVKKGLIFLTVVYLYDSITGDLGVGILCNDMLESVSVNSVCCGKKADTMPDVYKLEEFNRPVVNIRSETVWNTIRKTFMDTPITTELKIVLSSSKIRVKEDWVSKQVREGGTEYGKNL